ncbi:galactosylgalactosylxylosylprotein 3-beta-glucuronosyltransferase 1-like, partial [Pelobates fuscus]|uniref:galactosylgalactosylxylosylprotein 3-beta-glucuronosyltransferase 1-like n=1 Tax=Pelobates fuscus TaxID=191477 RepID=UPI002FE4BDD1
MQVYSALAEKIYPSKLPIIFAITPTYARLVQKADLTSVANTFRQVPALHWIVVEDSFNKTKLVSDFLRISGIEYTHLCAKTPKEVTRSRGALQRNKALTWLRYMFNSGEAPPAVVYFADDDNTYTLELFEEMRYTKKVSVWPVGLAGGLRYESVKVNADGKVVGWKVKYAASRLFAIDMAGFAVSLNLILENPRAMFQVNARGGHLEPSFLMDLVKMKDLEPKADNCTKILWVFKIQTDKQVLAN